MRPPAPPNICITAAIPEPDRQEFVAQFIAMLKPEMNMSRALAEWRRHWYGYSHKVRRNNQ